LREAERGEGVRDEGGLGREERGGESTRTCEEERGREKARARERERERARDSPERSLPQATCALATSFSSTTLSTSFLPHTINTCMFSAGGSAGQAASSLMKERDVSLSFPIPESRDITWCVCVCVCVYMSLSFPIPESRDGYCSFLHLACI
jgi:hypothetical protein